MSQNELSDKFISSRLETQHCLPLSYITEYFNHATISLVFNCFHASVTRHSLQESFTSKQDKFWMSGKNFEHCSATAHVFGKNTRDLTPVPMIIDNNWWTQGEGGDHPPWCPHVRKNEAKVPSSMLLWHSSWSEEEILWTQAWWDFILCPWIKTFFWKKTN